MVENKNHLVIMAGGVGSRFWPMSTPEHPKQFLDILGVGRTMLQMSVDRLSEIIPIEQVWIVTSKNYLHLVQQQLPSLPSSNILLEPCMRNTAPCIAYATWKIKAKYPDANLIICPSDHLIIDTERFRNVVQQALKHTSQKEDIITLGMQPSRPETGYGYIEVDENYTFGQLNRVIQFKEKPDIATAQHYFQAGNYFWNAGIFIWNVRTIENAIRKFQPDIADLFDRLAPYLYTKIEQDWIDGHYQESPSISIDYAVMEHAQNLYTIPSAFGWSDLGTWGSLYETTPHDSQDNSVISGTTALIQSSRNIVSLPEDHKAVIEGVSDTIIVIKDKTLLICRKESEQHIKEFSDQLL